MKTQQVYLQWYPEFNAFGVRDEIIENLEKQEIVPIIGLKQDDYAKLETAYPDENAALIGFLCCREEGVYTVDFNYAKALAQTGKNLRFMTYNQNVAQMKDIDGLMLPGGRFESPAIFYTDPLKRTTGEPGARSYAYITSIIEAERRKIPVLGVCAGAQMIGGVHGMKLYRDVKEYTKTDIEHKTKILEAHDITIYPNTPLYTLLGGKLVHVNSRHKEAMVNNDTISDLKIYAVATDGTPEAWGNAEKKILCIQWHPEDFAAHGNQSMQNLYDWLGDEAQTYKKAKSAQ
ncbi:MAG: gamma-glutamyl-gamma-aminobutyrate hydrolase family protein [Alphaproteobacteria bacterium]